MNGIGGWIRANTLAGLAGAPSAFLVTLVASPIIPVGFAPLVVGFAWLGAAVGFAQSEVLEEWRSATRNRWVIASTIGLAIGATAGLFLEGWPEPERNLFASLAVVGTVAGLGLGLGQSLGSVWRKEVGRVIRWTLATTCAIAVALPAFWFLFFSAAAMRPDIDPQDPLIGQVVSALLDPLIGLVVLALGGGLAGAWLGALTALAARGRQ